MGDCVCRVKRERERHQPRSLPRSSWQPRTRSRPLQRPNRPQTRCDLAKREGETPRRSLQNIPPGPSSPSGRSCKTERRVSTRSNRGDAERLTKPNLYNLCRLTKTRTRCSHREGRNVRGGWTNTPDVFKSRHDTSAASLSLFCSFSEGMSEQTGSSNSACCEIHGHFSGLDSIVWTCYAMA